MAREGARRHGSATFFDAFNALSLAFALPILIKLWHISATQSGVLIGTAYIGQLAVRCCLVGWRRNSGACRVRRGPSPSCPS